MATNWNDVNHPGVVGLNTGTVAANSASISGSSSFFLGSAPFGFRAIFYTANTKPTTTAAALATFWIGLGTQDPLSVANLTNFVGFAFDPSVDANNWQLTTIKAGARNNVSTAFAFTVNQWVEAQFAATASGVFYRINVYAAAVGAKSAAITTDVPNTTDIALLLAGFNGAAGTTTYALSADLWELAWVGAAPTLAFRGMNLVNNF
jgi:hypothetical protein